MAPILMIFRDRHIYLLCQHRQRQLRYIEIYRDTYQFNFLTFHLREGKRDRFDSSPQDQTDVTTWAGSLRKRPQPAAIHLVDQTPVFWFLLPQFLSLSSYLHGQ